MLQKGEELPVNFKGRAIYYVGPVDPVLDEVVGPAGPTTATRMDKFTEMMLAEIGLLAMIGKAERGPVAIEAISKHKVAYLMAVGGAAYLVARAIKAAKVVGFADLGMEAIYEFTVQGHAGDRRGRRERHVGARDRAGGMEGADRPRSRSRSPEDATRCELPRRDDLLARPRAQAVEQARVVTVAVPGVDRRGERRSGDRAEPRLDARHARHRERERAVLGEQRRVRTRRDVAGERTTHAVAADPALSARALDDVEHACRVEADALGQRQRLGGAGEVDRRRAGC